ncbi:hypothetical protein SMCF_7179 [Streptomyces sp. F-3]|uniref:Uncharacterized protein n=1 Tax=Streptomyces thermogriseus TaxID=75292 RepID=A0ABN1T6L9_9ACTN|nr:MULTISPECIES: hypothetical protein [Streptomyces]MDN5383024.1 hypothetical protein [Streptomyces sp. LB8]GAT81203.1 hypothetical protein SMCF_7179 [Streptomyces sp. F-3]
MSDASTTQPLETADQADQPAPGRGRHRGPASPHDREGVPSGRHRKPAEGTEAAA